MKVATIKAGERLVIGDESRVVEVAEIDRHGRWVRLKAKAPEHVRVAKAQSEPATTK